MADRPDHLVALPATRWSVWQDIALRSAGFSAARIAEICDPALARAADTGDDAAFDAAFARATHALALSLRAIAADPRFREAVAWQNPDLIRTCLDRQTWDGPRNARRRGHEQTVATYFQRYCLKNDTIGFFGPVGWATAAAGGPGLRVRPGNALIRGTTVYFEAWAVQELARTIADDPAVAGWLRPRRRTANVLLGDKLHRPAGPPVPLDAGEAEILRLSDGSRTLTELARQLADTGDATAFADEAEVRTAMTRLRDAGHLTLGFDCPVQTWPERDLRRQLDRIGDARVRAAATAPLEDLVAARDVLAAAAGDAEQVMLRTTALEETFRRATGHETTRNHGRTYAGRTLIYQDAVRDVDVRIGSPVLDALAGPLGLVLDSGRWLARTAGERYRDTFTRLHEADGMPLVTLVGRLFPDLTSVSRQMQPIVAGVVAEFQRRWQHILRIPAGVRRHVVRTEDIAAAFGAQFAAGPALWSAARTHSPDLMLAASDAAAVDRGDFLLVLGEIHLACTTVESRLFVQQHPDPARLQAAAESDHGDRRIYGIEPMTSRYVTSRVSPPSALLSPRYTYWSWSQDRDSIVPPSPTLPAASLVVDRQDDGLVVRSLTTGRRFDLLEVVGELLTEAVVNAFQPLPPGPHRPRVTIDRLVMCREAWTFDAAGAAWAFIADERRRYAAARRWRLDQRLPERLFCKVPTEKKPFALDFRSLPLVNLLAKAVRQTAQAGAGTFTVSEVLPESDDLWLSDSDGNRYTSELRFVAVDTE